MSAWQRNAYPDDPAERYALLRMQLEALLDGETDGIAGMANAAALLYQGLPQLNWAGFYRLIGQQLVLGPFQGMPACTRIPVGQGVCGTAVREDRPIRVPDVERFPGHIACDSLSRSELVIPLHQGGRVVGVLDMDSPVLDRFGALDEEALCGMAALLEKGCVFPDV